MESKRSSHDIACEVSRRMAVLREEHKRGLRRVLTLTGALCFALLACVAVLPNVQRADELQSARVSSLTVAAGSDVGGYVLVGVATFALGIVVALLCVKWKKHK